MMFTEVFSFAHKQNEGSAKRGVVTHIDVTIFEVCVTLSENKTVCVALDPHHCTDALNGIIREGGEIIKIECDYDESQRCVKLYLMVDEERVDELLESGYLSAEEHVINLAQQVWREAHIPHHRGNQFSTPCLDSLPIWNEEFPLYPHQEKTVSRMLAMESKMPFTFSYSGNLKITDRWFVDTESESFTTTSSIREAQLIGGICADGTGAGKTATLLNIVARTAQLPKLGIPYKTNATLVIIPLNLISQWQTELNKFINESSLSVYFLLGKEIRNMTMNQVCQADLIVTTFHFLRASKAYSEIIESALSGRSRTRPVLSSWVRMPNRHEPVLEAIHWKRIVIDELHETFDSPRDLRHLKLFTWDFIWGLTATPILDTEHAQHLYILLAREKSHHPNLLSKLIEHGVHCHSHADGFIPLPILSLKLVHLSAEERFKLQLSDTDNVADIVRRCTVGMGAKHSSSTTVTRRETLKVQLEGHERSVRIMEGTSRELESELDKLVCLCNDGDMDALSKVEYARRACDMHEKDLATARICRDAEQRRLNHLETSDRILHERLSLLTNSHRICKLCGNCKCDVLVNCCSRMFCRECIQERTNCPHCDSTLSQSDIVNVPVMNGVQTKMTEIGQLVVTLHEPVILFVQWKSMVRSARSFLASLGIRVLLLDGNTAQRTAILTEFLSTGVLLLCLEESFAGLHLPHVRQIIFAHAIVGDRKQVERLEEQAIARCVRHGQTAQVNVYSFVMTETEEEQLWRRTHS
jgi:hypothetical protein